MLAYILFFSAHFVFSKKFRQSYRDWLTLRDPLAVNLWRNNPAFLIGTICFFAAAFVFVAMGGAE